MTINVIQQLNQIHAHFLSGQIGISQELPKKQFYDSGALQCEFEFNSSELPSFKRQTPCRQLLGY